MDFAGKLVNPIFRMVRKVAEDDVQDYCAVRKLCKGTDARCSDLVPRIVPSSYFVSGQESRPPFLPKLTYRLNNNSV